MNNDLAVGLVVADSACTIGVGLMLKHSTTKAVVNCSQIVWDALTRHLAPVLKAFGVDLDALNSSGSAFDGRDKDKAA